MRILFLFFLLINVAFFYWQTEWRGQAESSSQLRPLAMPPGVQRLQLMSERDTSPAESSGQESSPVTGTESAATTSTLIPGSLDGAELDQGAMKIVAAGEEKSSQENVPVLPPVCYSLGPFEGKADANRAGSEFTKAGITVAQRDEVERSPKGFWIYLPPHKSYEEASQTVTQLRKKGISDLFIMGKGEHQNAISLGLYRSRSAAEERFNQVKSLGFSPEVEEQFRESTLTWLTLTVPSVLDSKAGLVVEIAGKYPKASLTQKACE